MDVADVIARARVAQARQITGLELADPETCFNLKLATRAWQTLSVLRS